MFGLIPFVFYFIINFRIKCLIINFILRLDFILNKQVLTMSEPIKIESVMYALWLGVEICFEVWNKEETMKAIKLFYG